MKMKHVNFWFGWVPLFRFRYLPCCSWFNGGSYWKLSFYWLRYLLEISGPKKDNNFYEKVTLEEFNKTLKRINS